MAVNEVGDLESLRVALEREVAEHAHTRKAREALERDLAAVRAALRASREQVEVQRGARDKARERYNQEKERHSSQIKEHRDLIVAYREKLRAPNRRQMPQDAIRTLLPIRAAAPPLMRDEREMAAVREQRFMGTSANYAAAIDAAQRPDDAFGRVTIEGLGWWVPKDERMPQRLERAEGQGFPLRPILQTRQVALGGVMLDLGGNIGRTSITRVILGDVRVVYAAEPEPANYACLVRNVAEHGLRGFALPDNVAIGATRGEVLLRRSRFIGGHRVLLPGQAPPEETVVVPAWPLDEWIAHHGIDHDAISFIKVDVQGQEVNILRGAEGLLSRLGVTWQMELDPKLLQNAGTSLTELIGLLARHFTHFIDMTTGVSGPTDRLGEAMTYVGSEQWKTDVMVFKAPPSVP